MKVLGNRKTASPFPLNFTSKAGFPLQISTGVRCRYVFPMRYKNTANGYCLRLSTAFEYEVHRKSTTNPRTMQIIREKNAKSLKFIPILGAREIYFPFPYIWNEMKYIGILYIYIFPLCHAKAMHLHKKSMHLHWNLMHLHCKWSGRIHLHCIWNALGMHLHWKTMHLHQIAMHLHCTWISCAFHLVFGFRRFVFLRCITPRRMITLSLRYGFVSVIP